MTAVATEPKSRRSRVSSWRNTVRSSTADCCSKSATQPVLMCDDQSKSTPGLIVDIDQQLSGLYLAMKTYVRCSDWMPAPTHWSLLLVRSSIDRLNHLIRFYEQRVKIVGCKGKRKTLISFRQFSHPTNIRTCTNSVSRQKC